MPLFWPLSDPLVWRKGRFQRHHRPSLAYRMVAEGAFDGMITFHDTWEWDICAGALIAAEAGVTVSDRRGQDLVFNNEKR